jgi:hypothetical protein
MMALMGSAANAQFRQSIFLNGGLATGQFASKVNTNRVDIFGVTFTDATVPLYREEIGKAATPGFGLGYRASYRFDVGMGEVAPFVQADVFWNFIKSEWSDKYIQAKGKAPNYFNIPVMVGVSYLYDELWNDITPYAEFGVGADLFIIGSEKIVNPIDGKTYTYSYKPTVALSWMFGVGTYFGRHVSAGVYYYGLGKHVVSYTTKTYNSFNEIMKTAIDKGTVPTRTVGELALRIGFHF